MEAPQRNKQKKINSFSKIKASFTYGTGLKNFLNDSKYGH